MKHWVSLVNVPEVDQYIELAKHAEEVGFYGITIADHLVMPTGELESKYPYTPDGKMWCYTAGGPVADPGASGPAPGLTDEYFMEVRDLVHQSSYLPSLVHGTNLYPHLQVGLYAEFRYYHQYDQEQPFYLRYGFGHDGTGETGVMEGLVQRTETELKMFRDGMDRDDSGAATDLVDHWVKTRVVVDSYNDLGAGRWHFKFYKQVEGVDPNWVELTTADDPYGLEINSELYVRFESYRPLQVIVDYVKVGNLNAEPITIPGSVVYEAKVPVYEEYYGPGDPQNLTAWLGNGVKIGFDAVLQDKTQDGAGQWSAFNDGSGKHMDVSKWSTLTCRDELSCGDFGFGANDFDQDCIVNLNDLAAFSTIYTGD